MEIGYIELYGKPNKFKEGYTIRRVPCFLCGKKHAKIIAHQFKDGTWGWVIKSFCLERR